MRKHLARRFRRAFDRPDGATPAYAAVADPEPRPSDHGPATTFSPRSPASTAPSPFCALPDAKCKEDPSLAVAHGCFWREHPARAWAWELRLQDEIGPDFRIAEPDADAARQKWLTKNPSLALEAVEKEAVRRMGRGDKRRIVPEMTILEAGLWSALPAQVWAIELRVAEKQGADFHLRAPDEPAERAAWEEANPEAVIERADRVANLVPTALAFGEESGEDAEDEGDGEGEE